MLIVFLPLTAYWLSKRKHNPTDITLIEKIEESEKKNVSIGAEKLDSSKIFSLIFGVICFVTVIVLFQKSNFSVRVINPNLINLCLLALALMLHSSINNFIKTLDEAIKGASGILIQFPLYFGILGIMQHSGLIQLFSDFFTQYSTDSTFNLLTFLSAAFINLFVPSGGGQWAVQGPIIIEAALEKGIPLGKSVMALAYGDQLTNMLQPFWALPLLGITKLKATQILPYALVFMLVGLVIFSFTVLIL
jgi:short-chain fatty acids transporter